jgi:hypothetical protein
MRIPGFSRHDQLGDTNQILGSEQPGFLRAILRRNNDPVATLLFGRVRGFVSHLEQTVGATLGLKGRDLGQARTDGDHGRHLGSVMPNFEVLNIATQVLQTPPRVGDGTVR